MPDDRLYGSIPREPARVLTDAEVQAMEAEREKEEADDRRSR
ncbi:MAG TPA: hypothetical protein VF244_06910 [Acidimicrobiales bacterium]